MGEAGPLEFGSRPANPHLEAKLREFQEYFNEHRTHAGVGRHLSPLHMSAPTCRRPPAWNATTEINFPTSQPI
jgi:hypothetical protein